MQEDIRYSSRYLEFLVLPLALFALPGCQTNRTGIDASRFEIMSSVGELPGAESDLKGAARAKETSSDETTVSPCTRQVVAAAANRTQGGSEGRSADPSRPLRLGLDAATPEPSELHGTQGLPQRSARLASWRPDSVGTQDDGYLRLDAGKFLLQDESAGATGASSQPDQSQEDLSTLGDKQINPLSDLWSLVFQYDATTFDGRISNGSRMRH